MINFWLHYVREVWANRLAGCRQVALFGAGEHAGWLLDAVASAGSPELFDPITVDGDHSRDGALPDLNMVAGALRIGGLLAFDDIGHLRHPYLHEAWNNVLGTRPNFETYTNRRDGTGIAAAIRYRRSATAPA